MKIIQLAYPVSYRDFVENAVTKINPVDWSREVEPDGSRETVQVLLEDGEGQVLMDYVQGIFSNSDKWRLVLLDVEATLPRLEKKIEEPDDRPVKKDIKLAMREALVEDASNNSRLNTDFIVLTILSAIVAAIGLNEDNIAVVIAAMVIAPLLGPVVGFSLGAALGSMSLMLKAGKTALTGLLVGFITVYLLALMFPVNLDSQELIARTNINLAVLGLALASGAAAALSMTGGLSSSLVGVMVAVALLPPSAASAIYMGAGQYQNAFLAAILVLLNIVCVLFSTQIVFVWKGVRPRRGSQQKTARKYRYINLGVWMILLVILFVLGISINNGLLFF